MEAPGPEAGGSSAPPPPPPNPYGLSQEQLAELFNMFRQTNGAERSQQAKPKTPDTFAGERTKLRGWLVQLNLYFNALGWGPSDETKKINYAKSLFRNSAEAWITPYEEEAIAPTWQDWTTFKAVLNQQFG
ncbi:MAG TPA: hypothetical protein VJ742_07600, partial [Nitrososphaera sp.]|nr:hypothetical protein [Nitrososphaera sp.]